MIALIGLGRASADAVAVQHSALELAEVGGVGNSVRPGRGRSRVKTNQEEKIKKPAEGTRKKSPPTRKAPARGRYVDEYARPAV